VPRGRDPTRRPVVRRLSLSIDDALDAAIAAAPESVRKMELSAGCAASSQIFAEAMYAFLEFADARDAAKRRGERDGIAALGLDSIRFEVVVGRPRREAHDAEMRAVDQVLLGTHPYST
jgi:hypothetical protein